MLAELLALLPEFLGLSVFGAGTLALSLAGLYVERFAVTTMQSGQPKLAAWMAFVGAVMLAFAYVLATDKFHPRLVRFRREVAEKLT